MFWPAVAHCNVSVDGFYFENYALHTKFAVLQVLTSALREIELFTSGFMPAESNPIMKIIARHNT
jgi:hypothetical protein